MDAREEHEPDGSVMDSLLTGLGSEMCAAEASELESKLRLDDKIVSARLKLIGFYFKAMLLGNLRDSGSIGKPNAVEQALHVHLRWMVDNRPGDEICGEPYFTYRNSDELHEQLGERWKAQVDALPDNAMVVINAANFFQEDKSEYSEALIAKAKLMDPERGSRWLISGDDD